MSSPRGSSGPILALIGAFTLLFALVAPPLGAAAGDPQGGEAGASAHGQPDHAAEGGGDEAPPAHANNDGEQAPPAHANNDGGNQGQADAGAGAQDEEAQDNRGSVKVKSAGAATFPPSEEPHLECAFDIHLFGFNEGSASVTILGHSPSGDGAHLFGATVQLDEAQGNEVSAQINGVDLTAAIHEAGLERHPQQGYHLKLFVDDGPVGGEKQKVFWVDCPPPGGETSPGGETPPGGEASPGGETTPSGGGNIPTGGETTPSGGGNIPTGGDDTTVLPTTIERQPAVSPVAHEHVGVTGSPGRVIALGGDAEVLGVEITRGAAEARVAEARAAEVRAAKIRAAQVGQVTTLPRTGGVVLPLALLGGLMLAAGVAITTVGRRRTVTTV